MQQSKGKIERDNVRLLDFMDQDLSCFLWSHVSKCCALVVQLGCWASEYETRPACSCDMAVPKMRKKTCMTERSREAAKLVIMILICILN